MSANLVTGRSKYECKLHHKSVQIWVQTFLRGSKYECKHWNVPFDEIRPEMRVRNSQRDFRVCTHIWTLFLMFALIFGPFCDEVCTHIWTDLLWSLHSYMDRPVTKFALIFGPTCYEVCTHIWTLRWSSLHSYLDPLVTKFALISGPPR